MSRPRFGRRVDVLRRIDAAGPATVTESGDRPRPEPDILPNDVLKILHHLPAPVLTSRPDGASIVANPGFCAVTGFGPAELSMRTVDDLFDAAGGPVEWSDVAGGGLSGWNGPAILLSRDGAPLHVHVAIAAIRLVAGRRLLWAVEDRSAAYWECPSAWGA